MKTAKFNPEYSNMFGIWRVTTEGDCEGRTVAHLGTFEGWLDEIALWLAEKSYYSLKFKKLNPKQTKVGTPTRDKVAVTLDIESGTWDMGPVDLAQHMTKLLAERDVAVKPGGAYAGFTLVTTRETVEEKREKALSKLKSTMSDEELEILSIKVKEIN